MLFQYGVLCIVVSNIEVIQYSINIPEYILPTTHSCFVYNSMQSWYRFRNRVPLGSFPAIPGSSRRSRVTKPPLRMAIDHLSDDHSGRHVVLADSRSHEVLSKKPRRLKVFFNQEVLFSFFLHLACQNCAKRCAHAGPRARVTSPTRICKLFG